MIHAGRIGLGLALLISVPSFAQGVWIDAPFVRQAKNGCGAATTAMLLEYWAGQGFPISTPPLGALEKALDDPTVPGSRGSAIAARLGEAGLRTFVFEGRPADLDRHLSAGRPLLVALEPRAGAPLHYVLVVGRDADRGNLYLNDPARGKLQRVSAASFLESWDRAGRWTLLALPAAVR